MGSRLNKEYLFWLRRAHGWTLEEAAEATGIGVENKRQYIRLENGETLRPSKKTLADIAAAFSLQPGELMLSEGQSPETTHLLIYQARRGAVPPPPVAATGGGEHPAFGLLAMDVDCTLLQNVDEYSWKHVWKHLQLPDEMRRIAMRDYRTFKRITYAEWCTYCATVFAQKGLRREHFRDIVSGVSVLDGFREGATRLRDAGVKLALISGGIDAFLEAAFPDYAQFFHAVFINRFVFTKSGELSRIDPTPYDFEGKVLGITELARTYSIEMSRVAFVGEGLNDLPVAGSGVGFTIALAPRDQGVAAGFDKLIPQDHLHFDNIVKLILGPAPPRAGS